MRNVADQCRRRRRQLSARVRIAGATGKPLDGQVMALTGDPRDALGINAYSAVRRAQEPVRFERTSYRGCTSDLRDYRSALVQHTDERLI